MAVSNSQRGLWTFLFHTLAGPFFAAVIVLLLALGAGLAGKGPQSLQGLALHDLFAISATWALTSYVWSALPAALAGAVTALFTFWRGTYPWLLAAAAGGIAAAAFAIPSGGVATQHAGPIVFIAAVVAIACRAVLLKGRIITP